jgi:hypothetical protein
MTETEKTFDAGLFAETVARFDSDKVGEAQNAFTKGVLMCRKHGLTFVEAITQAFGHGGGEVAVLRAEVERLKQGGDRLADALAEAGETIAALQRDGRQDGEENEHEHVIDLKGRLRRAWRFAQFRLFVLTVMVGALGAASMGRSDGLAQVSAALCLFLFGAWSVAQFHKSGFAQMLLKWLVYGAALLAGGVAVGTLDASSRPPVFLLVLAAALLLTLTKVSKWLGKKIRLHIWDSNAVRVVRGWFDGQ